MSCFHLLYSFYTHVCHRDPFGGIRLKIGFNLQHLCFLSAEDHTWKSWQVVSVPFLDSRTAYAMGHGRGVRGENHIKKKCNSFVYYIYISMFIYKYISLISFFFILFYIHLYAIYYISFTNMHNPATEVQKRADHPLHEVCWRWPIGFWQAESDDAEEIRSLNRRWWSHGIWKEWEEWTITRWLAVEIFEVWYLGLHKWLYLKYLKVLKVPD